MRGNIIELSTFWEAVSQTKEGCVRDSNIDQIPRSIVERVALRKGPLRFSSDSKG